MSPFVWPMGRLKGSDECGRARGRACDRAGGSAGGSDAAAPLLDLGFGVFLGHAVGALHQGHQLFAFAFGGKGVFFRDIGPLDAGAALHLIPFRGDLIPLHRGRPLVGGGHVVARRPRPTPDGRRVVMCHADSDQLAVLLPSSSVQTPAKASHAPANPALSSSHALLVPALSAPYRSLRSLRASRRSAMRALASSRAA